MTFTHQATNKISNPKLFKSLFISSIFLFISIYVGNIVVLFLNPNQFNNFKIDDHVFLGFYNLVVANNDIYLNWLAYFFGGFIILLTGINCFGYWIFCNQGYDPTFRKTEIIILMITSVVAVIAIYILNVFNRPTFDVAKLDLVHYGWNYEKHNWNWTMQFNYVFDMSFIFNKYDDFQTYTTISRFSAIWITMIVITGIIYVVTIFVCLFHAETRLTFMYHKKRRK